MSWELGRGVKVGVRCFVLACTCLCGGLFALGSAPAQAAFQHKYESQITEIPAEGPHKEAVPSPGGLSRISAMTTDAGDLYVDDSGRFDQFEGATGAFLSQLSLQGGLAGLEHGIAFGSSTGETQLYVGTGAGGVVGVFGDGACGSLECGVLQGEWTGADTPAESFSVSKETGERVGRVEDVAIDNSTSATDWAKGDVFVATASEFHGSFFELDVVDVFAPAAHGGETYVTQLTGPSPGEPFEDPTAVAVSGFNGDVLVFDAQPNRSEGVVYEFEPSGLDEYTLVRRLEPPKGTFANNGIQLAIDGSTGDIYVAGQVIEGGNLREPAVFEYNASGEVVGKIDGRETPAGGFAEITSVAVDATSGRVFVGDSNGGQGVVDEFGAGEVIPDVTTTPVSNVQATSVTLNGLVNPDGVTVGDCRFEYGETTSYGHSLPCAQSPAEIGSGNTPVAVSANLSGLSAGTTYHFRLSASNVNGTNLGADLPFGPPVVRGESAICEAQTSATLEAQVNPNGVDTTYRFEYGPTLAYGTSIPQPPEDLGNGAGDQAVSANLSGLQAGVSYHYRVVATSASGTTAGLDHVCSTVPPARIDSVTISEVTATSATVSTRINPLGSDTHYHIEYGPTASYGTDVPIPDEDIGEGIEDVSRAVKLKGLEPNITYHVRLVAANSLGTERSGDHTFVYSTAGERLPDNRADEMITPPQKNAALIGEAFTAIAPDFSDDGSRLIMLSVQCFADATSCTGSRVTTGSPYLFTRSRSGWSATALAPPAQEFAANSDWSVSADTGMALFSMPTPPMLEDDFYARTLGGSFVDIGPATPPSAGAQGEPWGGRAVVATGDFSHVVFQEGPLWPSSLESNATTPYEYVGTGNTVPVLVGVSGGPNSTDLVSVCETTVGEAANASRPGEMSADGRTVWFTAEPCSSGAGANAGIPVLAATIYARIDGNRTVEISGRSPANCTSSACRGSSPSAARFAGASDDGSKAFFTSSQQLTDEAAEGSENLYEYDFDNPPGRNLIDISAGDTGGGGPRVQGVVAVSGDGSHVYFVAGGVLTSEANGQGSTAEDGADNLYVFERDAEHPDGRIRFIATLPNIDAQHWTAPGNIGANANITPDGRFLVFTSHARLTEDDTRQDGAQQVFRFDAQTGKLIRISVGAEGFNDNGNGSSAAVCESVVCPLDAQIVEPVQWGFERPGTARRDPTMSHDGAFVFFDSPVGLAPHALNQAPLGGERYAQNVYEWHEGRVHLISDGRDTSTVSGVSAVKLLGSDAAGTNVFFTTSDPLVLRDTDTQSDVYDAHVCSAEKPCPVEPPSPLPPCEGEACHGVSVVAPLAPNAPSATFSGSGNTTVHPAVTKKKVRHCRKGRRRRHGKCVKMKTKRVAKHHRKRARGVR